ncbi:MAG: hypothetical protein Q8J59_12295 [Methylotenera sp.]|nr:hypothetical protein [Methylotenera sp.]MDO9389358.1 hypothetical protein [Methylotenera sp.]MDP2282449.1 hypothetical protein [Methylotenera sp.]MDP3060365.1 hypothetical protein [Methylotenera sp.]
MQTALLIAFIDVKLRIPMKSATHYRQKATPITDETLPVIPSQTHHQFQPKSPLTK